MARSAVRRGALLLSAAIALTACTGAQDPQPPDPPRGTGVTASSSPSSEPVPPPVVITHATVPQLRLNRATVAQLEAGEVTSWRRLDRPARPLRVVTSVAEVEADRDAIGVVSIDEVGPTVNVATVAGVDPIRGAPEAITLSVTGDIMLVRRVPDPAAALAPLTRLLAAADLTVGNLESTLSTAGSPTQGGDSFGASPALLKPLASAGFDALSLANNHAGDYGDTALLETLERMRRSPIKPFSAGEDLSRADRPAYLTRGGVRFAFIGFNAIGETPRATPDTPGALSIRMPPRTGPLVLGDLDHVASVIRRADRRADVVVVLPHWGTQYTHEPEPIQREVSQRLVAAGADLVVGGHPHWVQGVDDVRGVPVVHSLGNFVFDMLTQGEQALEGVVLETTWWGAELKAMRFVPYKMDREAFAPRRVRGALAADILGDVWGASTGPFDLD